MPETPPPTASSDVPLPAGGNVLDLAIEQELADSYLTYAMSTIVDRALPDVRDGLKPSQRRVLVAMNDLNLRPGSKHIKCAKICGDTSGNYHPHGEATIYPTLVNMAQDWKMRHVLIDKQGNFGSIDPDPPAAMRYTEARMAGPAADMLEDLKLDTVDWQENYDGRMMEPRVLPGKFPNLLVNGATGIAVGMATSMPPHNLGEICDALTAMVDQPDLDLSQIMRFIPGPDFPTGGIIHGRAGIAQAYATGRGRVVVRAKIHHEQTKTRDQLVVTQIPYQVSKNDGIVQKIVALRKQEKLTDIADIVDESSGRGGMRVVIHLKRGTDPVAVENQLYQMTPLQSTVSIINIALVKGRPRTLGLRDLLRLYLEHRVEVIRRRTAFKLREAQREAHRIEGLIYAVCDIDAVIRLIRESRTREEAIEKLMARGFRIAADHKYAPMIPRRLLDQTAADDSRLTRVQAESIGRLQLIQLVGLAIEELVGEYARLVSQIEDYEDILASPARVNQIIKDDIAELKTRYADPRKTVIEEGEVSELDLAALTPVEQVAVTITHAGYVKRLPVDEYRTQGRGGKGVIGAKAKDDDFTEQVFVASTHDDLLCFTDTGRVFRMKVYEIPEAPRTTRGRAIINILDLKPGERVCEYMPIANFEKGEHFLLFATANGLVKRTALKDYRNVNRSGIIALSLRENADESAPNTPEADPAATDSAGDSGSDSAGNSGGDKLVGVAWTSGQDHILLGTADGMAIRFDENDARVMGRTASGVKGITLAGDNKVIGLVRIPHGEEHDLLTVTENGFGKRTNTGEYLVQQEDGSTRPQGRGGKGRKDIAADDRNGKVVALQLVKPEDDLMLITQNGMIVRINADTIRRTGRGAKGVRCINLAGDDRLVSVARVADEAADDVADK